MSKCLAGLAALALIGAATLPLQANAAERHAGVTTQSTDFSAQRHWRHHGGWHRGWGHRWGWRHHWGPRYGWGWRHRYWGPRYGYYGYPRYGYYGSPYYRPGPFVSFGVGPFGFRVF